MADDNKDLFYLDELSDYKVASDYPDVRGWDLVDADRRTIGTVSHLLVSKRHERVVYLDVELDESLIQAEYDTLQTPATEGVHGFRNKEGDDHLIVPVGLVSIDEEQGEVFTDQIDYSTFTGARRFHEGAVIDRTYELDVYRHYTGEDIHDTEGQLYARKSFQPSPRRGTRRSS